jgi:hypothetical protein
MGLEAIGRRRVPAMAALAADVGAAVRRHRPGIQMVSCGRVGAGEVAISAVAARLASQHGASENAGRDQGQAEVSHHHDPL